MDDFVSPSTAIILSPLRRKPLFRFSGSMGEVPLASSLGDSCERSGSMRNPTNAPGWTVVALAVFALVPLPAATDGRPENETSQVAPAAACPVTAPNGHRYSAEPAGGNHGDEALVTELWLGGRVDFRPGGPGCVEPDGYLGMKWPWWRSVPGPLSIEGRRLDGPAGPLKAHISKGYREAGFQATGILFDGPGCWEVTGRVGDVALTFVTLVVKTDEGPNTRCSAVFGGYRPSAEESIREQE